MSYKPENDPISPEAVEMCEQVAIQNDQCTQATDDRPQPAVKQKEFLLTLDVERDKLPTDMCDTILAEQFNFSRNHKNDTLPESSYLGTISESENTSSLLDTIIKALKKECKEEVAINICGGFVEKFIQKRSNSCQ